MFNVTEAALPQSCTNFKLRQLTRIVTRHYDRHVHEAGLKNTQYALLSYVITLGPVRPGELAMCMYMDASTLTRNMQPLLAQKWLRMSAGRDARSRLVHITEQGRAKHAEGQQAWKVAHLELIDKLGVGHVYALHEWLDACIERLGHAPVSTEEIACASGTNSALSKRTS